MTFKHFFSLILVPVVIAQESTTAPPEGAPSPPQTSSFWDYLFTPGPEASPSPPGPTAPPPAEEPSLLDKGLEYSENLATEGIQSAAGLVVPPGTQVNADQGFLEQAASYINQAPGTTADPNTIFGLYDCLSGLIEPTPDGGVTMKVPTSDMLEKIKPWTDPYFDTAPLITALKGYEAYVKVKDTVGNVGDKVQGAASDVKDGVTDAANAVKDVGGEAVDKVKDLFGR